VGREPLARAMPATDAASSKGARPVRRLDVTEENLQRVFGMNMDALFKRLAKNLGYDLEG